MIGMPFRDSHDTYLVAYKVKTERTPVKQWFAFTPNALTWAIKSSASSV